MRESAATWLVQSLIYKEKYRCSGQERGLVTAVLSGEEGVWSQQWCLVGKGWGHCSGVWWERGVVTAVLSGGGWMGTGLSSFFFLEDDFEGGLAGRLLTLVAV